MSNIDIILLGSETCAPCKIQEAILKQLEKSKQIRNFVKLDVDKNKELLDIYHVKALPTLIFLQKRDIIHYCTGALTMQQILDFIEKHSLIEIGDDIK